VERSDEWLAPVSYLPGVQPSSQAASTPESAPQTAPEPAPADEPPIDEVVDASEVTAAGEPSENAAERQRERAHNVSLGSLTRRGMSRREVEHTLRSRDIDDDVIAGEIERLERVGLVDDLALAQNLVGILQERKGLGRSGIAAELTRRLLSPTAIEYALELVDTEDELGRAREIAEKRARQLTSYDHETAVRRLSGYLARRGYSGSTVRAAVDLALPKQPRSAAGTRGGVRFR